MSIAMALSSEDQLSPPRAFASPPTTPKQIPPTPNNTPASTPASSPTKSVAAIASSSAKKTKKMAKQKTQRPEKRHLVRWNEAMDKQLTLAMQYEANKAGITLPWEKIGARMGEKITGGAVIQHLAKMRSRLVEQGNPVPPSLKRGGGASRDPTTASPVITVVKNSPAKKASPTKSRTAKLKKASKKASGASDDSGDDDDDDWDQDESDADYGQPRVKRVKKNAKGAARRKNKGDESDEENSIDAPTGEASKGKRKRQNTKSSPQKLSAYGTTDINGVPIEDSSDTEDEDKAEVVAAGSSWLSLDDEAPQPKTGKAVAPKKSLVVSLPSSSNKTAIKEEETSHMGEEEIGEDVNDGSQMLSNEEIEQGFYTPQNNQDGNDLSAAQLNSGFSLANDNANSYQLGLSHGEPLRGEYQDHQSSFTSTLNTHFNNQSTFQPSEGLINNHGFLQEGATGLSGEYYDNTGGDFGLNTMDFSGQNIGALGGGFGGYQEGRTVGDTGLIPYPIQTSWPSSNGQSNNTSLNQTPAAPSAGGDFSGGYFNSNQHEYQGFDDGTSSTLFNVNDEVTDDNFLEGGWLGGGFYGN